MNGMSFETCLYTRLKFIPPTRKVFAGSEYFNWDFCVSNNRAYNNISKKISSKARTQSHCKHGINGYFLLKKCRYFRWNSLNSFKKFNLTLEVLCDSTKKYQRKTVLLFSGALNLLPRFICRPNVSYSQLCWLSTEPSPVDHRLPKLKYVV